MHPIKTQASLSNSSVTLSHPTPPSPPAVPTAPVKALTGGRRQGVGEEEQGLAKLPKFLRSNPGSKITWTHHAKGPGITKCFAASTHEVYAIAQVTAKNFQAENPAEICQRSHSAADRQIYTCRRREKPQPPHCRGHRAPQFEENSRNCFLGRLPQQEITQDTQQAGSRRAFQGYCTHKS